MKMSCTYAWSLFESIALKDCTMHINPSTIASCQFAGEAINSTAFENCPIGHIIGMELIQSNQARSDPRLMTDNCYFIVGHFES